MAYVDVGRSFLSGAQAGANIVQGWRQGKEDARLADDRDKASVARAFLAASTDENGRPRSAEEILASPVMGHILKSGVFDNVLQRPGVNTKITNLYEKDGLYTPEVTWTDPDTGKPEPPGPMTEGGTRDPKDPVVRASADETVDAIAATMSGWDPEFAKAWSGVRRAGGVSSALHEQGLAAQASEDAQAAALRTAAGAAAPPAGAPPSLAGGAAQTAGATPPATGTAAPPATATAPPLPSAGLSDAGLADEPPPKDGATLTQAQADQVLKAESLSEKVALARQFGIPEADIQRFTRGRAGAPPEEQPGVLARLAGNDAAALRDSYDKNGVAGAAGTAVRRAFVDPARDALAAGGDLVGDSVSAYASAGRRFWKGVTGDTTPAAAPTPTPAPAPASGRGKPATQPSAKDVVPGAEQLTKKSQGILAGEKPGPLAQQAADGADVTAEAVGALRGVKPGKKLSYEQRDALVVLAMNKMITTEQFDRAVRNGGRLSKDDITHLSPGNGWVVSYDSEGNLRQARQFGAGTGGVLTDKERKDRAQASKARTDALNAAFRLASGTKSSEPLPADFVGKALITMDYFGMGSEPEDAYLAYKAYQITKRLEDRDNSNWYPQNWFRDGRKFVSANVGMIAMRLGMENSSPAEIKDAIVTPALALMGKLGMPQTPEGFTQAATYNQLAKEKGMDQDRLVTFLAAAREKDLGPVDIANAIRGFQRGE